MERRRRSQRAFWLAVIVIAITAGTILNLLWFAALATITMPNMPSLLALFISLILPIGTTLMIVCLSETIKHDQSGNGGGIKIKLDRGRQLAYA